MTDEKSKDVFERVLLRYGGYILILIRNVFQANEAYEKCTEINKILQKYNVPLNMTLEDWQDEMWRNGTSGIKAMTNSPFYFLEACQMCMDNGLFKE